MQSPSNAKTSAGDGGADLIDSSHMIMFGTDNITLKKLNHAGLPKGHGSGSSSLNKRSCT